MSEYVKMDIVLQGRYNQYTNDIIDSYLKIPFVNNIILSCWEDDLVNYLPNKRVYVILNQFPSTPGTDNRNLQIITSLEGVKKVTTDIAIKMRTDQKYTYQSMIQMYHFFMKHKTSEEKFQYDESRPNGKIFVAGFYPQLLFHPRDHIFWGYTSDLLTLFDIPLEYNGLYDKIRVSKDQLYKFYPHYTRTETYIGAHYCSNFNDTIKIFLLYPDRYLYDYAPKGSESFEYSQKYSKIAFKSFPREGIQLSWPTKNLTEYPYIDQKLGYNECWHEEGF
jgi:hypothetical protein